jgi:hypothetical protein
MKYTTKYLKELANGNLVIPQGSEIYNAMVKETLRDLIRGNDTDTVLEEYIQCGDLVPFDYVSDLSEIINELARIILEEREDYKEILIQAQGYLDESIKNIDNVLKDMK